MSKLELKELLRRKKYDDSPNKKRWKNEVLKDFRDTNKLVETTLLDSKNSRTRLERSLDEAREVINRYHNYEDRYSEAMARFNQRRIDDERLQQEEAEKKPLFNIIKIEPKAQPIRKVSAGDKPTMSCSHKRRDKFIPSSVVAPFK